ncbi:MAG: NADH-quinone oxidoreductase subunit M [Phycisphaerae bacterium]|nr:NADH-quinone oxidoreductase subunit M [Phycisphaerae bacterium]
MTLWALLLAPLATAAAICLAPARTAKWIATVGACTATAIAVLAALQFPHWTSETFWPDERGPEIFESLGVTFELGLDGVSMLMVLMTVLLVVVSVIGSFTAVTTREREYYAWFMVLESCVLLAFMARDAVLFYLGYEFTLIPMYFLIAIWGGPDRRPAAIKFFIFTFLASVVMLVGIVYVASRRAEHVGSWSFLIPDLISYASTQLTAQEQFWTFLALMIAFAVKTPFFPVHSWLPLAHDQAPTAGSVILAGALLKLGTYGAFRIGLPMAPLGGAELSQFFAVIAILGIIAAAMICWVQKDVKKLVAYSSVSHMGMLMLGMFALNPIGVQGSLIYFVNHGLSTGGLFLLIGMIYERHHTKDMDQLGGLARTMPVWSSFMIFFTLSSVGLPGLNGFIGEVLCLWGCFTSEHDAVSGYPGMLGPWFGIIAIVGLILGALYMLRMVGAIVWGTPKEPHHPHDGGDHGTRLPRDMSPREIGIMLPLAACCLLIGLYPKPILESMDPAVRAALVRYPDAVEKVLAERSEAEAAEASAQGTVTP